MAEPLSREFLLARGTCCGNGCKNCPYMPDSVPHLLPMFAYEHLPAHLQEVSKKFAELAYHVAEQLPDNPEKIYTLRRLLEAKDGAVRTVVVQQNATRRGG